MPDAMRSQPASAGMTVACRMKVGFPTVLGLGADWWDMEGFAVSGDGIPPGSYVAKARAPHAFLMIDGAGRQLMPTRSTDGDDIAVTVTLP